MQSDIDKINNRIKMLGLKKNHIANRIGISPGYLSYMLNGKKKLTTEMKTQLFSILGIM